MKRVLHFAAAFLLGGGVSWIAKDRVTRGAPVPPAPPPPLSGTVTVWGMGKSAPLPAVTLQIHAVTMGGVSRKLGEPATPNEVWTVIFPDHQIVIGASPVTEH